MTTLTPSQRGDIRAAAAVCEVRGYKALSDRLIDLIPPACIIHAPDFGGTCMHCGEVVFTRDPKDQP